MQELLLLLNCSTITFWECMFVLWIENVLIAISDNLMAAVENYIDPGALNREWINMRLENKQFENSIVCWSLKHAIFRTFEGIIYFCFRLPKPCYVHSACAFCLIVKFDASSTLTYWSVKNRDSWIYGPVYCCCRYSLITKS